MSVRQVIYDCFDRGPHKNRTYWRSITQAHWQQKVETATLIIPVEMSQLFVTGVAGLLRDSSLILGSIQYMTIIQSPMEYQAQTISPHTANKANAIRDQPISDAFMLRAPCLSILDAIMTAKKAISVVIRSHHVSLVSVSHQSLNTLKANHDMQKA